MRRIESNGMVYSAIAAGDTMYVHEKSLLSPAYTTKYPSEDTQLYAPFREVIAVPEDVFARLDACKTDEELDVAVCAARIRGEIA